FLEELQPFCADGIFEDRETGRVAARSAEAFDHTCSYRIGDLQEYDRQRSGHKQTKPPAWTLSALPPKADKHWHRSATPLRAKSGRMHRSKNTLRRDAC